MIEPTWDNITSEAERLARRHPTASGVYGVPRGGVPVAVMVAGLLDVPILEEPTDVERCLVVDDLVDTGATASRYPGMQFDALYRKPHSPQDLAPEAREVDGWISFPWESEVEAPAEDNVTRLLQAINEDPTREGLVDTPRRVVKALREMTSGMTQDPSMILNTTFDGEHHDEMVVVSKIPFQSLCEHHLLPFTGHATVAYIPADLIVGLSKIPRLVHCFARRLQIQEQLTTQIAEALEIRLVPIGVGVILTAHHTCMSHRGVRSQGKMTTSAMLGAMRDNPEARAELLALHTNGHP